ncbi:hypothetical protein GJAV_G00094890 [Gymnothorax javanicus]|nr:hypothetical protein GJAV_G00094890 [Gymnothorax javanicus]
MAANIPGLIATAVFYLIILATGIWASRKAKQAEKRSIATGTEVALVAGRNMNIIVGIFTITATWVGGGYILSTAATAYSPLKGLALSLPNAPGGVFFAKHMRNKKYITMMDPFQLKYGDTLTCALLIPAVISEVLFIACIMAGLGGTMRIILDISSLYSICISAAVAIIYTLLGGMFSVAYTDVIQLIFIFFSLWLCVPFLFLNSSSTDITRTAFNGTFQAPWLGTLALEDVGLWIDDFLLLSLGGLASQALHQRILSAASSKEAQIICFAGAGFCFIMGIPSVLFGAVAASTDWNTTSYGFPSPYERGEADKILPIALQYLCPDYISIFGIGAIAAAVMSSIDSCLLACSSLFTNNLYKSLIRKRASDRELKWVIKISVAVFGLVAMGLALLEDNVLTLWFLGTDVLYTMVFPQFICVIFFPLINGYGAVAGYILGVMMRLLSGEPLVNLPPTIHFPGGKQINGVFVQNFPCRTLAMLVSLCANMMISTLTSLLFANSFLPKRWDILQVRTQRAHITPDAKSEVDNNQPTAVDQLLDTTC